VQAAGGIVLRREQPPRIAVVRLRKRDEWVLPKGKLDDGETPRAAAKREVLEETGHNVTVHEFLGTMVHENGNRSKVVHFWSMEASGEQARELMDDVRAVDWLPLDAALERLSRGSERVFLESVGPLAVNGLSRRLRAKLPVARDAGLRESAVKMPAARKRRGRLVVTPEPALVKPSIVEPVPPPEFVRPAAIDGPRMSAALDAVADERVATSEIAPASLKPETWATSADANDRDHAARVPGDAPRRSLVERLRDWFGRAA
jgi:8-oxo-dGTP diphosphatase